MVSCPSCGTQVASPTKLFTVIVEPKEGERGLTQRKVGMYACDKCGTKFPTVVSRQHYLVVPDDQMTKIQGDIRSLKKTNDDLEKRIQQMDGDYAQLQRSLESTKKNIDTKVLMAKLEELERSVTRLKKEKEQLVEKAARLR